MKRAVVIGASLAGPLCARVLAARADEVLLVERDDDLEGSGVRRAVPQGRHVHALWHTGLAAMEALDPGLSAALVEGGAVPGDGGLDFGWWWLGQRRPPVPIGRGMAMTRPFLEATIRERTLALPNVRVVQARAEGLSLTGDRVDGLMVSTPEGGPSTRLAADLVVDCSGRASQLSAWLAAEAYDVPPAEQVVMDIGYATRFFRRRPGEHLSDGTTGCVSLAALPGHPRCAVVVAVEGDRWLVGTSSYGEDRPTSDADAYYERCWGENMPPLTGLLATAEPISEVVTHRMVSSVRRDFHRMSRFPQGLLVAGDAIASFNPVYGQGMTCAALHARALRLHLDDGEGGPAAYFKKVKKVTNAAWALSAGEDFRLPTTRGRRPRGSAVGHWVGDQYARAVLDDPKLHGRFLRVASMGASPLSLLSPAALARVGRRTLPPGRTRPISCGSRQPGQYGYTGGS